MACARARVSYDVCHVLVCCACRVCCADLDHEDGGGALGRELLLPQCGVHPGAAAPVLGLLLLLAARRLITIEIQFIYYLLVLFRYLFHIFIISN